ncbi:hypothetical protein D9M68_799980 [compost metagenome]
MTQVGDWRFANDGTINRTHIGKTAYILDDQTVTATSASRSPAGRIEDIESDGSVWVHID